MWIIRSKQDSERRDPKTESRVIGFRPTLYRKYIVYRHPYHEVFNIHVVVASLALVNTSNLTTFMSTYCNSRLLCIIFSFGGFSFGGPGC